MTTPGKVVNEAQAVEASGASAQALPEGAREERHPPYDAYVLNRYPVLKIHHTVARHTARNPMVAARLVPTATSATP